MQFTIPNTIAEYRNNEGKNVAYATYIDKRLINYHVAELLLKKEIICYKVALENLKKLIGEFLIDFKFYTL